MSDLMDAAVAYVKRGWAVFPVEPEGKKPAGRLVPHGLKQATADEGEVVRWWKREPRANIGLRTGLTFDVLDVDGAEGMASISAARPEGAPTVDGPTCETGGGGAHVYLAVTEQGNKAGLIDHIDWRGRGGYVVAPPSIHASGRLYTWIGGWSPEDQLIRASPPWLIELLTGMKAPSARPPGPASFSLPSKNGHSGGGAYGSAALERELGRVISAIQGTRNDVLNKAAFAVGQLIAGGEIMDAYGAVERLRDVGIKVGLEEKEVVASVRSGIESGSLSPRTAPRKAG